MLGGFMGSGLGSMGFGVFEIFRGVYFSVVLWEGKLKGGEESLSLCSMERE
jgi:hypothetical protein